MALSANKVSSRKMKKDLQILSVDSQALPSGRDRKLQGNSWVKFAPCWSDSKQHLCSDSNSREALIYQEEKKRLKYTEIVSVAKNNYGTYNMYVYA